MKGVSGALLPDQPERHRRLQPLVPTVKLRSLLFSFDIATFQRDSECVQGQHVNSLQLGVWLLHQVHGISPSLNVR